MLKACVATAIVLTFTVLAETLSTQVPPVAPQVDFRRDVQPIFIQHCIGCHGPSQQMNRLRLDRRSSAFRLGTGGTNLSPGNSGASRLYLKLIGNQYGLRMPPSGPLSAEQLSIIKTWIDQGANWPDDVAGETAASPADASALRLIEMLRRGDRRAIKTLVRENPSALNRRGDGGSTPLMYAALYGDAKVVQLLLEAGANPSIKNDAGATALMWALDDASKSRLFIEHGAGVNARSEEGRTPLAIAAAQTGSAPVVKLLLDQGATPVAPEGAQLGNEMVLQMLNDHGLDLKGLSPNALITAARANCTACVDMVLKSFNRGALTRALSLAAQVGDVGTVRALLDRGADVNEKAANANPARDGRTPLMLAAGSEAASVELIKAFLDRVADVHLTGPTGETALDLAKLHGETAVVDLLRKAGAEEHRAPAAAPKPKPAASVQVALSRSIPLLQRSDAIFFQKTGCVSCHNNSLTAMTVAVARERRIPINDQTARQQLKTIGSYVESYRERTLQGIFIPGGPETISYILLGMAAEHYPPDAGTDALAHSLKSTQFPDGSWTTGDPGRPPIAGPSDIPVTARSLRAIRVFAPTPQRDEYERAAQRAASWLVKALPNTTDARVFRLFGLAWAGLSPRSEVIRQAARDLIAEQRSDGGWAQLSSLSSDAYATGQALVALQEVAAVRITDPIYMRGIQFLLNTQLEDGSWYVKSRALGFQPYFESGFPHGRDQWISAAATNWASMALALSVPRN